MLSIQQVFVEGVGSGGRGTLPAVQITLLMEAPSLGQSSKRFLTRVTAAFYLFIYCIYFFFCTWVLGLRDKLLSSLLELFSFPESTSPSVAHPHPGWLLGLEFLALTRASSTTGLASLWGAKIFFIFYFIFFIGFQDQWSGWLPFFANDVNAPAGNQWTRRKGDPAGEWRVHQLFPSSW